MSRQYDYDRPGRGNRQRNALSPWVPLILTVTAATIGLAAWVWSERKDDDEDDYPRDDYQHNRRHEPAPSSIPPPYGDLRQGEMGYGTTAPVSAEESSSYMARMSGALRRTPSPQQFFDTATRTVSAGMAAAGAVVGSALSSIREEDKNAYKDHKTWSEEAEARQAGGSPKTRAASGTAKSAIQKGAAGGRRQTVAIVVSADNDLDGVDDGADYSQTHAVSNFSVLAFFSIICI
jgi:hypothetical protein